MMEIYNRQDNQNGIDKWSSYNYHNNCVIGAMRIDLDLDDLKHWYSAFLKIENCLYPVMFRDPIERRIRDFNPVSECDCTFYRPDFGPSIRDNEICVSKNVLEAMIWQGHISTFTMKNGMPVFKSPLDGNQTAQHYNEPIDVEVIPYDFSDELIKVFEPVKDNCLNTKFKMISNGFLNSVDGNATKSMMLDRCYLGEQGTVLRIFLGDDISSNLRKESFCYFLSFTSYGLINTIYDRKRYKEQKIHQMETPKSIEEAQIEYYDWVKTIGDKNPTVGKIIIDKSGVSIDNIDSLNKKEKKVEESDELLI